MLSPPGASVTDLRERVWGPHYRRLVRSAPLPSITFSTPSTVRAGTKWRPICVSLELQASIGKEWFAK